MYNMYVCNVIKCNVMYCNGMVQYGMVCICKVTYVHYAQKCACIYIYIYIISKICKNLQYDIVIVCIKRMICTVCQIRIICIMDTHVYIYIYTVDTLQKYCRKRLLGGFQASPASKPELSQSQCRFRQPGISDSMYFQRLCCNYNIIHINRRLSMIMMNHRY